MNHRLEQSYVEVLRDFPDRALHQRLAALDESQWRDLLQDVLVVHDVSALALGALIGVQRGESITAHLAAAMRRLAIPARTVIGGALARLTSPENAPILRGVIFFAAANYIPQCHFTMMQIAEGDRYPDEARSLAANALATRYSEETPQSFWELLEKRNQALFAPAIIIKLTREDPALALRRLCQLPINTRFNHLFQPIVEAVRRLQHRDRGIGTLRQIYTSAEGHARALLSDVLCEQEFDSIREIMTTIGVSDVRAEVEALVDAMSRQRDERARLETLNTNASKFAVFWRSLSDDERKHARESAESKRRSRGESIRLPEFTDFEIAYLATDYDIMLSTRREGDNYLLNSLDVARRRKNREDRRS